MVLKIISFLIILKSSKNRDTAVWPTTRFNSIHYIETLTVAIKLTTILIFDAPPRYYNEILLF